MAELFPCKCGLIPDIIETYDTLQVVYKNCRATDKKVVGDYYDEAFMKIIYGQQVT